MTNLTLLHNMIWDSNTAYLQTLMWYITGEEVYREYALKIIDYYCGTNSIRCYINDDRIRVSLAVDKICIAAEILRYADFDGAEELKWTEKRTEDFTRYLLLMRQKHDRYGHFMNQHNFCVSATIASAVFRNDWEAYKRGIQRATTNPELQLDDTRNICGGALCDRNGECMLHARSGDILSLIREVTVDKSYRDEFTLNSQGQSRIGRVTEPNIQLMELGRDIGHAYCNIGHLSYDAHTALIQGTKINNDNTSEKYGSVVEDENDPAYADSVNMFEFADHRLLKGANYIVKYTRGYDIRYVPAYWGTNKWGGAEYYAYPSNERSGYEYWNRFDAAYAGIYNYYRYFDEGIKAMENKAVTDDDIKYLTKAFIRTYPEMFFAEEFIGLGSLFYSNEIGDDYDVIEQKEYFALQNVTVDSDNPDEVWQDDGYLYTGGQYNTYIQFDLSQIEERDLGELDTLGLEVQHSSNEPGESVKVEIELYTGDWEQSTATYNKLRNTLKKIEDVMPPKTMYLRNSFSSKHLLQEVISELKAKGYKQVTFRLHQIRAEDISEAPPVVSTEKKNCARVLSLSGTENSHARPRLVTHKLVPAAEVPPPDESEYETPGERLMTQKTNVKDFGYVFSDVSGVGENNFRLTKIDGTDSDVYLGYTPGNRFIVCLGEGDLTDLKRIHYWGGYNSVNDITLYYTRADDERFKTKRLGFTPYGEAAEIPVSVGRYYMTGQDVDDFIYEMRENVLAAGQSKNTAWKQNEYILPVENAPQGRYKVYMVLQASDPSYIRFEYGSAWDISFSKSEKKVKITLAENAAVPETDDEFMVYTAVYTKDDEQNSRIKLLKDVDVKRLAIKKGEQGYSIVFDKLSDFESGDEVRIFLWGAAQNPLRINKYTILP